MPDVPYASQSATSGVICEYRRPSRLGLAHVTRRYKDLAVTPVSANHLSTKLHLPCHLHRRRRRGYHGYRSVLVCLGTSAKAFAGGAANRDRVVVYGNDVCLAVSIHVGEESATGPEAGPVAPVLVCLGTWAKVFARGAANRYREDGCWRRVSTCVLKRRAFSCGVWSDDPGGKACVDCE